MWRQEAEAAERQQAQQQAMEAARQQAAARAAQEQAAREAAQRDREAQQVIFLAGGVHIFLYLMSAALSWIF